VLFRVKEQRNILHEISKRKANCIGQILRGNCLLRQPIGGKIKGGIEVKERRGRRRKLLDNLTERRGYSDLKEEALDRTMWRAGFGTSFGPVVRQTAKWMNKQTSELSENPSICRLAKCQLPKQDCTRWTESRRLTSLVSSYRAVIL
jgi:hypothetical protein